MVRPSLDRHIPSLHQPLLAALQLELDLALDHDPKIERPGAEPNRFRAGVVVDVAQDDAARDHERGLVDQVVGIGDQIGIVGQGRGEGGGGVAEEEVAPDLRALPVDVFGD